MSKDKHHTHNEEMQSAEGGESLLTELSQDELIARLNEAEKKTNEYWSVCCACRQTRTTPRAVPCGMWKTRINMRWKSLCERVVADYR